MLPGYDHETSRFQESFKKVDYDYVVRFARHAQKCGAEEFHLVSALGAATDSSIFYNRVKGETEEKLETMGFRSLFIYQPSLLVSKREERRVGEKLAIWAMKLFNPLLFGGLKKYRSIHVRDVARGIHSRIGAKKEGTFKVPSNEIV